MNNKTKKLLSVFLAAIMLLCAAPLEGIADIELFSTKASAAVDGDFAYKVENGEATITDYDGDGGDVKIPGTIDGYPVTNIGEYAFYSCIDMTSVTIPNSVISISEYAFEHCSGLKSLTIPNSVKSIADYAFDDCSDLISVTIPNSVTSIGNSVFSFCSNLASIEIPNSITNIGWSTFYNCTGLTSVTLPNSVTSIGSTAFCNCSGLITLTIPKSVTSIGWHAFEGCTGLKSITVDPENTVFDSRDNCNAIIETNSLILGCNNTVIPDNIVDISSFAFAGCTDLKSVSIPNSVAFIGNDAFYHCTGLKSVTIPNSVVLIGSGAFGGCSSLTSIKVDPGNTVYDSRDNCNAIIETATNTLISGCKNTVIPYSVTSIGCAAFDNCDSLTSITIPNSITSISESAFSGCTGLTSVTIPNSVTSIGDDAFRNCTGLTGITIPNGVTSIGEFAFYGCSDLTSITISNSVTSIGDYAFAECTCIKNITIENGTKRIGNYAFHNCTGLTSITLPDSLTYIGESAFSKTGYFDDENNWDNGVLYIGNNLVQADYLFDISYCIKPGTKTIANFAFGLCERLRYITIPDSVTNIGDGAFVNTEYYDDENNWEKGVLYIGNHLIEADDSVSGSYTIKNGTKTVANCAFFGCTALMSITVPDSVTGIGEEAFGYYEGDSDTAKIAGFTVYGRTGSSAETYANENGFRFVDRSREENCTCGCHKTGLAGFFFKIKLFFWKIFRIEKNHYCLCGKAHW